MAYSGFKDLPRRSTSDKSLRNKAFDIAKNPKYDRYQCGLASIVYEFVIKSLLHLQVNLLIVALSKIRLYQTSS